MTPGHRLHSILLSLKLAATGGRPYGYLIQRCEELLADHRMRSLVAGYGNPAFPQPLCISVNEVLLHGVVDPIRSIEAGDIVRLDLAAVDVDSGEAVDSAITFMVQGWGTNRQLVTEARKRMFDESLKAANLALEAGIKKVVPGGLVRDASKAMRDVIRSRSAVCLEAYGYGLSGLADFTGHGIGAGEMHMDPSIPSYPTGPVEGGFIEGRTYCLEPMVYPYVLPEDHNRFWILPDGWSVRVPSDRGAHVEHTVLCTASGPVVLTGLPSVIEKH